jgi:hypothetical protein
MNITGFSMTLGPVVRLGQKAKHDTSSGPEESKHNPTNSEIAKANGYHPEQLDVLTPGHPGYTGRVKRAARPDIYRPGAD